MGGVDVNIGEPEVRLREICARFRMIGLVSSPHHGNARGRQVMAAAVEVRTFWSALLSVLLKCIAALGFTTPASRAAVGPVETAAPAAGRTATAETGVPAPRIPAPRGCEPASRRERDRTLPPTMKQRIRAEAHGSSPSARSIRTGDLREEMTPALALAEATAGAATVTACPATATAGPATAAR
jgi:hypothetical protein